MDKQDKAKGGGIARRVDRLGQVREQIEQLKLAEVELRNEVAAWAKTNRATVVEGRRYVAMLSATEEILVDARRFWRKVAPRVFFAAVRVSTTAARAAIGDAAMRRMSRITKAVKVAVRPKG
jgi:hypothetical protein